MVQRRRLSTECNREVVAMLESPGVRISQIAAELGIGVTVLGRWRRELRQVPGQAFVGPGRPRNEDMARVRRVLARVTKERDVLREAAACFASAARCSIGGSNEAARRFPSG